MPAPVTQEERTKNSLIPLRGIHPGWKPGTTSLWCEACECEIPYWEGNDKGVKKHIRDSENHKENMVLFAERKKNLSTMDKAGYCCLYFLYLYVLILLYYFFSWVPWKMPFFKVEPPISKVPRRSSFYEFDTPESD